MSSLEERQVILGGAMTLAEALAETFAPLCEVVVHDLQNPEHAVVAIFNNMSGREVGNSATELGLARLNDPDFPDQLINYENTLPDGRRVKSTSVGLRDSSGRYVAALCINVDLSFFQSVSTFAEIFMTMSPLEGVKETISSGHVPEIEEEIRRYAVRKNKEPRALNSEEKRELISALNASGSLQIRGASERIAKTLGMSRSSVYYYVNSSG